MINITCEDNIELMSRYPDRYFELAIVDPPYGIGESSKKFDSRSKIANSGKYKPSKWDNSPPDFKYFNELIRVSKNQIIWGANHFIDMVPFASSCWIVWDKDNGETDYADCELAYTSFKSAVRKFKWKWQGMLQQDMKNKQERIHPTEKPVALYKWILDKYAKHGDKILDTHIGSGSIAIACHDYGFDLTGCELDSDYYKAAMKRLKEHQLQQKLFQ